MIFGTDANPCIGAAISVERDFCSLKFDIVRRCCRKCDNYV